MRNPVLSREEWPKARAGAADVLSLAAAPTFALMALLTSGVGGGPPDVLCSAGQGASLLGGMVPMYVLMSTFHCAPWLKLIANWQMLRCMRARLQQS